MTIQLFNVPPDATAAISPGGPPVTLTTTVPGQNAVASFTGTAGRRVALATSSSISFLKTIIIGPGGTQLAGPLYTSAGNGFIDTVQLPSDGTYTILADPQDERTGPVTLTLYDVPADVTTTITPGGAPASATTTAAGQNALFTFSGVAGRRVSLGVSSSFYLLKTSILNPDGTVLAGPGLIPLAEEAKVIIGIEEVWNKFLLSPLEFARYVDEFESPWIRAYFDIGNVAIQAYPQDWIRTLGKRIVKLHVKDFSFKKRLAEFTPLLEGEIDWRAVHAALADIGYQGTATVELSGGDAAYLKEVNSRFEKILTGQV